MRNEHPATGVPTSACMHACRHDTSITKISAIQVENYGYGYIGTRLTPLSRDNFPKRGPSWDGTPDRGGLRTNANAFAILVISPTWAPDEDCRVGHSSSLTFCIGHWVRGLDVQQCVRPGIAIGRSHHHMNPPCWRVFGPRFANEGAAVPWIRPRSNSRDTHVTLVSVAEANQGADGAFEWCNEKPHSPSTAWPCYFRAGIPLPEICASDVELLFSGQSDIHRCWHPKTLVLLQTTEWALGPDLASR